MFSRFAGLIERWTGHDPPSSAPTRISDASPVLRAVRRLRDIDAGRQVFGADLHGYLVTRVPNHELDAFEDRLGTCLPETYRAFLSEIGYGAGPYYGTLSPAEILRELDDFDCVPDAASRPFPVGTEDGERFFFGSFRERLAIPLLDWPTTGLIPVAYRGETSWSVLVTSGLFTGTVWDINVLEGIVAECRPALRPPTLSGEGGLGNSLPPLRRPPIFDEWYRGWLVRAFADFEWK